MTYFIYANSVVATSTGVLSGGVAFAFGCENWLLYGLFAFFSTLIVYNGQRLVKAQVHGTNPWLVWVKRNTRVIYAFIVLSLLASIILFIELINSTTTYVLLGLTVIIAILYVMRIGNRNAREIPYLKIHLIAFTWTVVLIVFPLINEQKEAPWWLIIAHYIYVLAVAIPFDIRDLKHDMPSQKTIPQVLGVNGAKMMGAFLLLLFAAIMVWNQESLLTNPIFYFAVFIQIYLVVRMNEDRSDFYCAGWIDGAILLLGVSYFYGGLAG